MNKTPEKNNRLSVVKGLSIFLEGSVSLNWLIDIIEYSGIRGSELTEIFDELSEHGDHDLFEAISAICRRKGWLTSLEEPALAAASPPLALIIEDNEDSANLFANALTQAGFEIEVIRSGDAALVRLAEAAPAVVILDLHLPRVSGAEILHHIRADQRLAKAYVVVATAYPDMAINLNETADQMFLKPVSYIQLRDLMLHLGLEYTGGLQALPMAD